MPDTAAHTAVLCSVHPGLAYSKIVSSVGQTSYRYAVTTFIGVIASSSNNNNNKNNSSCTGGALTFVVTH